MRFLFLAIPILLLGFLGGCVWPPDSTPNTQYSPPYLSYFVHYVSQRSLLGVETTSIMVTPNTSQNIYGPDSLRYFIVNGDTVFRNPVSGLVPIIDSSVPYHLDGSENFISFIFPASSFFDTSYVTNPISQIASQITSPAYADTILRSMDALFAYQTSSDDVEAADLFQITDSVNFYSEPLEYYNESVDFPINEMQTLNPGTLWADLQTEGLLQVVDQNYSSNIVDHSLQVDRIVAYHLK